MESQICKFISIYRKVLYAGKSRCFMRNAYAAFPGLSQIPRPKISFFHL